MGHHYIERRFRDQNYITDAEGYEDQADVFQAHVNSCGRVTIFNSQGEIADPHYLLMEKIVNWVKTLDLDNLVWNEDDIDEFLEENQKVITPPEWIENMLERT